jgi:hypothetical protein
VTDLAVADLALVALTRLNIVVASATLLVAFSLLAYLFVYNFRDAVARGFVALLAFASASYTGDLFLATARLPATHPAAAFWLRFEWLGIAFVAPAFLHFADCLLQTTGERSRPRRAGVIVGYAAGVLALAAVWRGHALVGDVVGLPGTVRQIGGPLFLPFAAAYGLVVAWGARGIARARARALTTRSRRRMTYLLVSVIAPLSVFPYLAGGGSALAAHPIAFQCVAALGNVATAAMIVVVAYAVAYHGALSPDRAIKREMIKYLIQGPVLGVFVIATTQAVPARLQSSLGLPRDVVFALAVVVGIVLFQLVYRAMRPLVDALIYGSRSREAIWLQRLDERLLTTEDLAQLLEQIVAALCDRLRVPAGYVLVMNGGRLQVDAHVGPESRGADLMDALQREALGRLTDGPQPVSVDGFWVWALRPPGGGATLGLLAVENPARPVDPDESEALRALVASAERALEDRVVQQRVLATLRALEPELAGIQRLRGALERTPLPTLTTVEANPVNHPDFPHWVKDALSHYWGGPKLTDSPLLGLRVVRDALEAHDYNTTRAVRAVLDQALERLRPEGERSHTASQWLVYNILELKFVRGLQVRDIAQRLALSESDLYRKQRVAVEALSRQLAAMERDAPPATGAGGEAPGE